MLSSRAGDDVNLESFKREKMSKTKLLLAVLAGSFFVTGCASMMMSDDIVISNTANVLQVKPSDLTVTGRRENMMITYYTATTKSGNRYACTIAGGDAFTFGVSNPPICNKY